MDLNTMLCLKRSDLSGFNEGATRRKLFSSTAPNEDSKENCLRSQKPSQMSRRGSSVHSTPTKRSILRAQDSSPSQGSPSSVRSVRFSGNGQDFSMEYSKIHVNESTQTADRTEMHYENNSVTPEIPVKVVRRSDKETYIGSLGSPKTQQSVLRQSSPKGGRHNLIPQQPSALNQIPRTVQTSMPQIPDGLKIVKNMDIPQDVVNTGSKLDGQKIIQNIEISRIRDKSVQTDDQSKCSSKASKSASKPDGNEIIKNLEIDTHKSGVINSTTQTTLQSDGMKIVQNMDIKEQRKLCIDEANTKDASVQVGMFDVCTQTPSIPDGNKIIKNLEFQSPLGTIAPFKSISIQTNNSPNGEQLEDGHRIVQNKPLERIRSPSPETNDRSFGFDVNLSFSSTQTDPEIDIQHEETSNEVLENEPVLIYDKSKSSESLEIITNGDQLDMRDYSQGQRIGKAPPVVTDVIDNSILSKHSAKMLLERKQIMPHGSVLPSQPKTYLSNSNSRVPDSKTNSKQSSFNQSKPPDTSFYDSHRGNYDGSIDIPAGQWIAPTVPTKLRSPSPIRDKIHVMPLSCYDTKPLIPNDFSATVPNNSPLTVQNTLATLSWQQTCTPRNLHANLTAPYPQTRSEDLSNTGLSITKPSLNISSLDKPNSQSQYRLMENSGKGDYDIIGTQRNEKKSKIESFSRSPIDVYSFDPESVKESKRLLSKSVLKESITKNKFIKGIALNTRTSVRPYQSTLSNSTSERSSNFNPYIRDVLFSRSLPVGDYRYSGGQSIFSSRYTNLSRSNSAGPISRPSSYTGTYARTRSPSSPHSHYNGPQYQPSMSSLTPNLSKIRTTAIRKNSTNASFSTHATRPISNSSSPYLYNEISPRDGSPRTTYTLEHRSRSREKTRGANSRSGYKSPYSEPGIHNKNKPPLYLENLTDASNERTRSNERLSKSRNPIASACYSDSEHRTGEHYRSRSSSANGMSDLHISSKPPLPKTLSRKSSPSPKRQSSSDKSSERKLPPSSYMTKDPAENPSYLQTPGIKETANKKITIRTAPYGLIDKDCIYLDERSIQRIIESAVL